MPPRARASPSASSEYLIAGQAAAPGERVGDGTGGTGGSGVGWTSGAGGAVSTSRFTSSRSSPAAVAAGPPYRRGLTSPPLLSPGDPHREALAALDVGNLGGAGAGPGSRLNSHTGHEGRGSPEIPPRPVLAPSMVRGAETGASGGTLGAKLSWENIVSEPTLDRGGLAEAGPPGSSKILNGIPGAVSPGRSFAGPLAGTGNRICGVGRRPHNGGGDCAV
jgi:hypothetical protein